MWATNYFDLFVMALTCGLRSLCTIFCECIARSPLQISLAILLSMSKSIRIDSSSRTKKKRGMYDQTARINLNGGFRSTRAQVVPFEILRDKINIRRLD